MIPLLRTLFAERQTTALYVTHESREAVAFDARIAVLQGRRIVADGLPAELAVTPPPPFVRALFAESTLGKRWYTSRSEDIVLRDSPKKKRMRCTSTAL